MSTLLTRLRQSSLTLAGLLTVGLLIVGTLGYILFEGWSLLDAIYATVITITTVGYGDLSPQSVPGRAFAIIFTLIAIGIGGYTISTLAAIVIENERTRRERSLLSKRMQKISELKDHVIVCGAPVLAHRASLEFMRRDQPFIFVEPNLHALKWALLWMHPRYVEKRLRYYHEIEGVDFSSEEDRDVAELAEELGILYLIEDPKDEQALIRAGLGRARGIIAALEDDLDNMAIVLSARDIASKLNNQLRIVSRVSDEWNTRRLYLAGADHVMSPNINGGLTLANSILNPIVNEFLDSLRGVTGETTYMSDIEVDQNADLIGKTVQSLKKSDKTLVLAVKRENHFIYAPDDDLV
ncbi:MAG: NAD-binding protein, partial [Chloroflexota bacterium]